MAHVSSNGVVTFDVGGHHFSVLKLVVRRHPTTLLASLLDDICTDNNEALFVDANPDRFQYILDWYRYGEISVKPEIVQAVVLDARYFLLPDQVKINGRTYDLKHPSRPCVQDIFDQHRAAVAAQWPTFESYVRQLANEAMAAALHGNHGTVVDLDNQGCDSIYFGQNGRHGRVDLSTLGDHICWHQVEISSSPLDGPSGWADSSNVCNAARLQLLVHELQSLGFDCKVFHFVRDIKLNIGVKLRSTRGVTIDGVDIIVDETDGYHGALAVAKTWDQTKDEDQ